MGDPSSEAMRILVVDENALNREVLSRRLVRRGFEVEFAEDGAVAIERARANPPALILMDLSMPVMDGWEATRQLKADARTRTIPIIALTAHAMEGDRRKALDAGCDEFETKPVQLDRLLKKMAAFLGEIPAAKSRLG
jgi:two-component system, cell cycle response regulator DivK